MSLVLAIACAIVALVAVAIATRRLSVDVTLQAHADEDGAWTLAGGGQVSRLVAVAVAARGVALDAETAWTLRVLGRPIARVAKPKSRSLAWAARVDPVVAAELGLDAFGRVRVDEVRARVRAAFADPLTTGRIAEWLAVARGLFAPVASIDSDIDWCAERDALDVTCGLRASFIPLLVAIDLARFACKHFVTSIKKRGR